jgi:Carboxypeptidase regulatory-like domain
MTSLRAVWAFPFIAVGLMAQQNAGALHGTLTDSSGAFVPAASISLSGENLQRTTETPIDGSYSFNNLVPGRYTIKVDFPGFEPFESGVNIEAGRVTELPIQLKLMSNKQELTVATDRGPELSTDPGQSASALTVTGADLDALPDDPDDLSDMLTALAGPSASAGGAPQILLDGFSGGQLPPKAAIKEIKINQNPFSADYDNPGFGRIEIITKPGADMFRGSVGMTESTAYFNSRNPYAANKADYLNRMFTGNAAGSFFHRLSYTFNFYQSTINNTALINAVTLNPATLEEVPVRATVVTPRTDYSGTGRIDYQISPNNTFTGSYLHLSSDRDNNGIGQYSLPSRAYSSENSTDQIRLVESSVLGANAVTDARFGFTRYATYQYGDNSVPSLIVASSFNGGSAQVGQASNINTLLEFQSNTTVVQGTHTIRFGGRGRNTAITDISPSNFGGTFSFFGVTGAPVLDVNNQPTGQTEQISSLEQYRRTLLFQQLGYSPSAIQSLGGEASQFSIAGGNPSVGLGQADIGMYILDDWRWKPNITLSMGLRYETQSNIRDYRDFAPRFGIAWSPPAKNGAPPKTVIRLGSGMFYGRIGTNLTQQALRFNGVTQQQFVVQNPLFFPTVPSIEELLSQGTAAQQSLTTYRMDPRIRALAFFVTAATVERQLPGKTSVSATYYREEGRHLVQTVNINTPFPGTFTPGDPTSGIRPYGDAAGNIFQYETGGVQNLDLIWVEVNNHLNQRVSFSSYYQFNSAHGNIDNNGSPSNPYDFAQDYSRTSWTRRNNFNFTGTFLAPGGVQLSPFFVAASGQPYNLTIGSDLNGDTIANDRPAFATDMSRPSVVVTRFGAFDTSPMPGQTIVPRNYLTGVAMWNINMRISKTFGFGAPREAPPAGYKGPAMHRYGLNFNLDVNNILNHVNQGGFVGNLSSPLFGQSTMISLFRDTSNNRRLQFGTQFTF